MSTAAAETVAMDPMDFAASPPMLEGEGTALPEVFLAAGSKAALLPHNDSYADRLGFRMAYTRIVLVKRGPGLAPSP